MPSFDFHCPKCHAILNRSDRILACPECSAEWPVEDHIPRFIEDEFYWGFTSQETMSDVLETAREKGWMAGVDHYVAATHPADEGFFREYACREERANWRYLASLSPDSKVLDLGSGWGATAVALSRVVGQVVALDATYENLQMVDIRCQQENITNVVPVNADVVHYAHLPLPEDYFDLVVMVGVLEWMGDARPEANAIETQKSVLSKIRRVLKPTGQLYLAIENRFGFAYFLGKPDEHSNLRFVTLLPRGWADFYSRAVRKKPYRTYTHSSNALRHLLRDSGFSKIEFYAPISHFTNPRYYVSLESSQAFDYLIRQILRSHPKMNPMACSLARLAARVGLLRTFTPCFGVIAGSQ